MQGGEWLAYNWIHFHFIALNFWILVYIEGYAARGDDLYPSFLLLNDEYLHALPSDLCCIPCFLFNATSYLHLGMQWHSLLMMISFLVWILVLKAYLQSMMQTLTLMPDVQMIIQLNITIFRLRLRLFQPVLRLLSLLCLCWFYLMEGFNCLWYLTSRLYL